MSSVVTRMLARSTMRTSSVVIDVTPRFLELDLQSNLDIARRAGLGNDPERIVRHVHVHTSEIRVDKQIEKVSLKSNADPLSGCKLLAKRQITRFRAANSQCIPTSARTVYSRPVQDRPGLQRKPGLQPYVHPTELRVQIVEVQVRILARDTNEGQPRLPPANLEGLTRLDTGQHSLSYRIQCWNASWRLS